MAFARTPTGGERVATWVCVDVRGEWADRDGRGQGDRVGGGGDGAEGLGVQVRRRIYGEGIWKVGLQMEREGGLVEVPLESQYSWRKYALS